MALPIDLGLQTPCSQEEHPITEFGSVLRERSQDGNENDWFVPLQDIKKCCRTANQKWVEQDPNIGFYSGAALHDSKGERLGVLYAPLL